jgi:Ca2+-binding EF-hand superfamily protein
LWEKRTVFFSELGNQRENPANILAHELGHTLRLFHEDRTDNLMQTGGHGKDIRKAIALTQAQIDTARTQSEIGPFQQESGTAKSAERSQGRGVSVDQRQRVLERLRRFDLDNDGMVARRDVPEQGRRLFDRIDRDANGIVDERELQGFSTGSDFQPATPARAGAAQQLPRKDRRARLVARMEALDRNSNGQIESWEVPEKARRAFERIDRDGDGTLDRAELRSFSDSGSGYKSEFLPRY